MFPVLQIVLLLFLFLLLLLLLLLLFLLLLLMALLWAACCCCCWSYHIQLWSINVHLRLLKDTVEFVWGGWGGLQSHFRVKPRLSCGWVRGVKKILEVNLFTKKNNVSIIIFYKKKFGFAAEPPTLFLDDIW